MAYENETLGALLSDPRISPIAGDAIRNRNLSQEPLWGKTLAALREEHFFSGDLARGIARLYRAAAFRFLNEGPQTLGVCGQTGAGKSTLCGILRNMGMEIVDTDLLARQAVSPGSETLSFLAQAFGKDILLPDGALNRPALAALAFSTPEKAKLLSDITHPAIIKLALAQAEDIRGRGKWAAIDAPLLFTAGLDAHCDAVIKVTAPQNERLKRIMARDGLSEAAARSRIQAGAAEDALSAKADYMIENLSPQTMETRVREILLQWNYTEI